MTDKEKALAFYVPSLRGGGAERVMLNLANGFASRGFVVDLIVAKAEGPYLEKVSAQVNLIDLGAGRVIASLPGVIRYLRARRPVALLSAMGHANVVATLACRLAGVGTRAVVSEHAHVSTSLKNARSLRGRHMIWLMRRVYRRADAIVAVSRGVADDLLDALRLPNGRVCVIHNPIVDDSLQRLSREPAIHPWFESNDVPVIVSVGRLERQKNFSVLLRALVRLAKTRNIRLVILGEGSERDALETEVRELGLHDRVDLPGFVDNPYAFMRASDLFVLSSAWEGFGNVLVEAMACGTPVVSTACPSGPAEILEQGRWGRLVPVGDSDTLATAMAATLDEDAHPDVVVRANDFSVETAVDKYLDVMLPDGNGTTV